MNEKIKKACRNYNIITKCEFLEDDLFSKKWVSFYKKCVEETGTSNEELMRLSKFDYVMRKYIEDYNFSKMLKGTIDYSSFVNSSDEVYNTVLEHASLVSDEYDNNKNSVVINTRWI